MTPNFPNKRYRIILADPPWYYYKPNHGAGASQDTTLETHYETMQKEDIKALPVSSLADDNCILFLWATSPRLDWAIEVIAAWGFTYKTSLIWDKMLHNVGYYVSVRHEFLLIGGVGRTRPDNHSLIDSVVSIQRTKHSVKPEYFQDWIDSHWTWGERIELFARRQRPNWDCWGLEVEY